MTDPPLTTNATAQGICRECLAPASGARCPSCGGPLVLRHAELHDLEIVHVDCDAFFAAVEKRDNPELLNKPVIIGGARRGVVSTACYIARTFGVHSAMPMFQALKRCPDAVVVKPDGAKYARVGKQVRTMMQTLTPLVEPISIDEAFLDLSGTRRLHGQSPAATMAAFVLNVEREIGISVSVGLSHNKFLAKVASDFDKPRGFRVIGRAETLEFLEPEKVSLIWGVGKVFNKKLERDGIRTIGELRARTKPQLTRRYGTIGARLYHLSRGEDSREIKPRSGAKSVSAETTFNHDIADLNLLSARLWRLCEKVSTRMKKAGLVGHTATLKLKTAGFKQITRSRALPAPTHFADTLYRVALPLLSAEANGTPYRLIGIGFSGLAAHDKTQAGAEPPDLFGAPQNKATAAETAIDKVRARFGPGAVTLGRGFKTQPSDWSQGLASRKSSDTSLPRKTTPP
ncbi:MAG: DNA polymerase IV [Alphaproteobacteria bacterium]